MSDEQIQQTSNTGEAPLSIIERAEAANKVLEENIKKQEEILRRQEEVAAKQLLAGKANAGFTEAPKVESAKEYAERIMRNQIK